MTVRIYCIDKRYSGTANLYSMNLPVSLVEHGTEGDPPFLGTSCRVPVQPKIVGQICQVIPISVAIGIGMR